MEEIKTCSFMDQMYQSGDKICQDGRCVVCRNGEWEEEPVD
ncbi:MAG: hypothetical protein ACP5SH_12860 [Syntrophobacteraceae bacterium]